MKLAISQAVGPLKHDSYWLCAMRLNWAKSLMPNKTKSHLSFFPPKGTKKDILSFPRCHLLVPVLSPNDCYPSGEMLAPVCASQSLFCDLTLASLVGWHREGTQMCVPSLPQEAKACSWTISTALEKKSSKTLHFIC